MRCRYLQQFTLQQLEAKDIRKPWRRQINWYKYFLPWAIYNYGLDNVTIRLWLSNYTVLARKGSSMCLATFQTIAAEYCQSIMYYALCWSRLLLVLNHEFPSTVQNIFFCHAVWSELSSVDFIHVDSTSQDCIQLLLLTADSADLNIHQLLHLLSNRLDLPTKYSHSWV